MAIDITPICEVIERTIHYEVYEGNLTLLPPSYPQGIIIITCLGFERLSGEVIDREPIGTTDQYREVISWLTLYRYQLDMMRAVDMHLETTPLVPFEMECSTVVSALDYNAPQLANDHGLGISPLNVNYSMELDNEIPLHRMTADFTIRALDVTRMSSLGTPVQCVDLDIMGIRRH